MILEIFIRISEMGEIFEKTGVILSRDKILEMFTKKRYCIGPGRYTNIETMKEGGLTECYGSFTFLGNIFFIPEETPVGTIDPFKHCINFY